MSQDERRAIEYLLQIAVQPTDPGRRVADFLLAWWSPGRAGGFDLTTMWGLDETTVTAMTVIFAFVGRVGQYPIDFGLEDAFQRVVATWRPELLELRP